MMEKIQTVAHIGITAANLERSIAFYCDNFGFTYLRGAHFPSSFFEKNYPLYQLPPETTQCHTAVLESPARNVQLELFQFTNHIPQTNTVWNRSGMTHFAVTVENVLAFAQQLKENNVEFCIDVGVRPDGGHWVFVRDPDGNLIEVMEPFRINK